MGLVENDGAGSAAAIVGRREGVLLRQISSRPEGHTTSKGIFEHIECLVVFFLFRRMTENLLRI